MSYGSYSKNSTFPAPAGGSTVTAVVPATYEANVGAAAEPLSAIITSAGNSIATLWQVNEPTGNVLPEQFWVSSQDSGLASTVIWDTLTAGAVAGPTDWTFRAFNADGAYRDYIVAVTVVNNP